jgi:hypothetical protein
MMGSSHIEQNHTPWGSGRWGTPLLSVLALFVIACTGSALAQSSPMPGNPIGPGTVPPSSYEKSTPTPNSASGNPNSLVGLPGPMGNSANAIITGNVGGGKYFRGSLPYSPTTSISAPLGSTRLDPFLRYSTPPEELSGYPGGYNSFYSPTGTVATTQPGYRGITFAPTSPRIVNGLPADRPADVLALSEMSQLPAATGAASATPYTGYDASPGAMPATGSVGGPGWNAGRASAVANPQAAMVSPFPSGAVTNTQSAAPPGSSLMTPDDYRLQLEQLQRDIERVKANALALEQSLKVDDDPSAHATEQKSTQAVESSAAVIPGGTSTPPYEQPSRPDEGLVPKPQMPGPAPGAGALHSQAGPRVVDVRWLAQPDRTDGAVPAGAALPGAALAMPSAPPAPSLPAPTTPAGRIDAIFAPQGRQADMADSPIAELSVVQPVRPAPPAVPGVSPSGLGVPNPQFPGGLYPSKAPVNGSKPSPEQISALIARLRGADGRTTAPGPGGNNPALTLPEPLQQSAGDRTGSTWQDTTGRSFTQERFDRCVAAAESYLRQGRYYRAAESFTFAAIYRPNDAGIHLGKSYALFGAGEYLSSALYLARAIELDARTALARSDLVDAIGGPAVFAGRITDLEQCARTGNAPELQFLLAYVYRQMNRPVEAKAAMALAEKQLAPVPAVELLKAFIGLP